MANPRPDPSSRRGVFHEVTPRVIAHLLAGIVFWLFGILGTIAYGATAVHDIFRPSTVDIQVSLSGKANPGDQVELFPLPDRATLDYNGKTRFEAVAFDRLQNRTLELRTVRAASVTPVCSIPIGNRPTILIEREVR